jgi:SAM-dependent methyltransferase
MFVIASQLSARECEAMNMGEFALNNQMPADIIYNAPQSLGVPFAFLPLLSCPACRSGMSLVKGFVQNNMVISGDLRCACGKNGFIEDGIVVTGKPADKLPENPVAVNAEYLNEASPEYISYLFKGLDWIFGKALPVLPTKGILLELGTGTGYFLRHAGPRLPVGSTYIAVDHDFKKLQYVKRLAEQETGWLSSRNIVFLCSDFRGIPITDESLDMVIDFYGTTNYNFFNTGFPVEWLTRKLKKCGRWLGAYFIFRPGAKSLLRIDESFRPFFFQSYLTSAFPKSPLMLKDAEYIGFSEKAGEHESFFVEGDRVHQWVYYGERAK